MTTTYPSAPESYGPNVTVEWVRRIAQVANLSMRGKTNNIGLFTLTASVAASTLSDVLVSANTIVQLFATTANAAAELGGGTCYQTYPNTVSGKAVINHANSTLTDRIFAYVLTG